MEDQSDHWLDRDVYSLFTEREDCSHAEDVGTFSHPLRIFIFLDPFHLSV